VTLLVNTHGTHLIFHTREVSGFIYARQGQVNLIKKSSFFRRAYEKEYSEGTSPFHQTLVG
jgi:hypothetical protein